VTITSKAILRSFVAAVVALAVSIGPSLPNALADQTGPSTTSTVAPAGSLPGIDVSHWQDAIDWTQVGASGISFAIAKATQGRSFVDPMYAANKAGAEAAGLAFTAYHFAEPDATPHDALAEANHFVAVAGLTPGNLIPALDLERTGGLSPADLTRWVLRWLDRVTDLLGVRPMVYTSPNGWSGRTADTTAIADAGFTVLWLAHWDVAEPIVPADGWVGNGWTFWQFSDCVAVPGIDGCVDGDWFGGASLDALRIPVPDVTPPTAAIATPSGLGRPAVISFSEAVHDVTPTNVQLSQPDTAQLVRIDLACANAAGRAVDCLTGPVRTATVQPQQLLVAAQPYSLLIAPPIVTPAIVDNAGNPLAQLHQDFETPGTVEQNSPGVVYRWRGFDTRPTPWRTVVMPAATTGRLAMTNAAGASASFTFRGTGLRWTTLRGPKQGRAAIYVDGRLDRTVDNYAPTTTAGSVRTIDHLLIGVHTVRIVALGQARPKALGAFVAIDRLSVVR
jgi:GH25 family lysozyme M1 (1,4-beta-N-acetylmuramidase)